MNNRATDDTRTSTSSDGRDPKVHRVHRHTSAASETVQRRVRQDGASPLARPRQSLPADGPTVGSYPAGVRARPTSYERFIKPVLDWVIAFTLLTLLSPVMIATAVLLWFTLGSPILFRQTRMGRGNQPFSIYKFRTMHADRRQRNRAFEGPDRRKVHKTPDDPRHTRTGRFLRLTSLDELPQLFNVLKGEMSLVGPRPELLQIVERYEPWQHARHQVKPGLTGLWQVSARGSGLMHEHVDIDLAYVKRVSFKTDCTVLLKTVPALLKRDTG